MFYIFFPFSLVCVEKNILANFTNSQELEPEPVGAGCFWLLGAGAGCFWLLGAGAGAAIKKKSGAGAAKKFAGSPALQKGDFIKSNNFHKRE